MTLIRWNPAHDLVPFQSDMLGMQRELNRIFDNFFRGDVAEPADMLRSTWAPSVDIRERDNDYLVNVELPGVSKDDVKITLQDNILTVRGEKNQEKESKESKYHRVERVYGSFQRSFALPAAVKAEKIDASYKDGILTVSLPKAEEAKPKQIEVKVK